MIVVEGACWQQQGDELRVPENLTLLPLPRYAPELNLIENIWDHPRSNKLSNTVWQSYDEIVEACCVAWNWLTRTSEIITSIATFG